MKKLYILVILLVLYFLSKPVLNAQTTENKGQDEIPAKVENLESDVSLLKKIKFTGYIQGQFQLAQTAGIKSVAGGDFPAGIDKRFMVRRGRLKASYMNSFSQYTLQTDATENGIVLKEANLQFSEPWLKLLSLKAGLFLRPFGFEEPYSSSLRESPEFSRFVQYMLPGEYDLGFSIILQPPSTSPLNVFKLEGGLFNGTNNKPDFDNKKDFIGHLSYNQSFLDEKLKIGAGISYYNGGMANASKAYYTFGDTGFVKHSIDSLGIVKREYEGFDAQLSYESPIGMTTIRGEYMWGIQAGTSSSSKTPIDIVSKDAPDATNKNYIQRTYIGDSYLRNFQGGYITLVQRILQSKHRIVLKYDWLDPNTKIAGKEIGKLYKTDKGGDIAYNTLGIGWIYSWDENVKLTLYYDIVKNEATSIKGFTSDVKDNILTVRVQYAF